MSTVAAQEEEEDEPRYYITAPLPEVVEAWTWAIEQSVAVGIPRYALNALRVRSTNHTSSHAGAHRVIIGTNPPPRLLSDGLRGNCLHELGHCVHWLGDERPFSPLGDPTMAAAWRAAWDAWREPWDRSDVANLAAFSTDPPSWISGPDHRITFATWWSIARVHPRFAAIYEEIDPPSAYGATSAQEDFADSWVLYCTDPSRMGGRGRARMETFITAVRRIVAGEVELPSGPPVAESSWLCSTRSNRQVVKP